jgi:hypothetical protein
MSPLAITRQVAACTVFVWLTVPAWAADPPATPVAASQTPAAEPTQGAQPTRAAQPAEAAQPPQVAQPAPAGQPAQVSQPAAAVQLLPNTPAQIARSALLSVEAVANADTLQLRIQRVSDRSLVSSDDVTVSLDGRNEPVTRQSSGAYELAINNFRGDGARDVEITVAHDGIREALSGKVSVAEAGSASGLLSSNHKQLAWWVLNIVVVLIAAIAISRRKG